MKDFMTNQDYEKSVHTIGRTTLVVGFLLTLLFPMCIWLIFGIVPTKDMLLTSFIATTSIMLPTAIIEILTYAPLLGSSGLYITTLTGSYMALRIPCAIAAMDAAEVERGTEKADLISTVGIAVSVFVSVGIILLSVVLMVPLQPVIEAPVLQPAFNTILSSVFGALTMSIFIKNPSHCILPMVIGFIVVKTGIIPSSLQLPFMVVISLVGNRILYKLKVIH